jgi:hypothetical protein
MTGKTKLIGTRAQVWHGTCKKTSGGLTKSDLMMNKHGHIVSKAKHMTAKKEKRLLKYGYGFKKGKFGAVKMGTRKMRKSMRGGMYNLNPADVSAMDITGQGPNAGNGIAGQGITVGDAGSANVQLLAGMAGGSRRGRGRYMRGGMECRGRYMRGGMECRGRSMRGGMYNLNPADVSAMDITGQGPNAGNGIAGQGITVGDAGSANVQLLAGMAGGKRRRGRGRSMRGGTTKPFPPQSMGSPLNAALNA